MEGDEDVPKIKLGDASCAAPFTSKLSYVSASESVLCMLWYMVLIFFSHAHHPSRTLYARCYYPDVQVSRVQLPDHGMELECTVLGLHQVW